VRGYQPDTEIGPLEHACVVVAVADGRHFVLKQVAGYITYLGFLVGSQSSENDGVAFGREQEESIFLLFLFHDDVKGHPVRDEELTAIGIGLLDLVELVFKLLHAVDQQRNFLSLPSRAYRDVAGTRHEQGGF